MRRTRNINREDFLDQLPTEVFQLILNAFDDKHTIPGVDLICSYRTVSESWKRKIDFFLSVYEKGSVVLIMEVKYLRDRFSHTIKCLCIHSDLQKRFNRDIHKFTSLEDLTLTSNARLNDGHLSALPNLTKLAVRMDPYNRGNTTWSFSSLTNLRKLTSLELQDTLATTKDILPLTNLTSLKLIHGCKVKGMRRLASSLTNLTRLKFAPKINSPSDNEYDLKCYTQLKKLHLIVTDQISDFSISCLTQLETLKIVDCPYISQGSLEELPYLTSLKICGGYDEISYSGLTTLKSLTISDDEVNLDIDTIKHLTNLERLSLPYSSLKRKNDLAYYLPKLCIEEGDDDNDD